jgi:hypothetical protein
MVTNAGCAIAVAMIAFIGCIAESSAAPAQQKNATTPIPPPRPSDAIGENRGSLPNSRGPDARDSPRAPGQTNSGESKNRAAPQSETSPAKQATPSARMNASPQKTEAVFPTLPAASRARMRDCGREWQEMKRTGQAKELTWRDFATQCLTR